MARKLIRIAVNVSEELLKQIDDYGDSLGITRTAAISVLCSQMLLANNTANALSYAIQADKASKLAIGQVVES